MPRVSVVMAVYNTGRFVAEAAASILVQTYSDFELIAVDDASSDGSLSVLKSLGDPRVRIIRHYANAGAALSRNDALAASRGELIAIMDADDICAPTRLERQVAYLDEHPLVGLVGCGIYENIDVKGKVLCASVLPSRDEAIQSAALEGSCFLHSSIMFRKELLAVAGEYRSIFEPVEDYEFLLRILEHTRAYNIPERLVSYRLNPRGLSVGGHTYMEELKQVAIRTALRRRSAQPEGSETEKAELVSLKRRRNSGNRFVNRIEGLRNRLYVSRRYFRFGYDEVYAHRWGNGRRCFARSLLASPWCIKSWLCYLLSLFPSVGRNLLFLLKPSERSSDRCWLESPAESNAELSR